VQNVKVAGRISDVARLSEGTVKRTVKVLKNDNVIVPNNDKERHVNSGRSSDDVDGQDDEVHIEIDRYNEFTSFLFYEKTVFCPLESKFKLRVVLKQHFVFELNKSAVLLFSSFLAINR